MAKIIQIKASFNVKHTSSCRLLLSILLFWKVKNICYKPSGPIVRHFIFGYEEKRATKQQSIESIQVLPSSMFVTHCPSHLNHSCIKKLVIFSLTKCANLENAKKSKC